MFVFKVAIATGANMTVNLFEQLLSCFKNKIVEFFAK